jgi:hypothetical protein
VFTRAKGGDGRFGMETCGQCDQYCVDVAVLKHISPVGMHDKGREEATERERLTQQLAQIRGRLERAYTDELDGKITEEFWETRSLAWNQEQQQLLLEIQALEQQNPQTTFDGSRILELATSVYPTYRKTFELIFQRVKKEEWCARRDSNSRHSASKSLCSTDKDRPISEAVKLIILDL